jgi:hypothetical protein
MKSAIQHLSDVTPLQLQRAIRDYRYEVGEGRTSQECLECLDQMQRDWEHWRVKSSIDKIQKEVKARTSYRRYTNGSDGGSYLQENDSPPIPDINTLFDPTSDLASYSLALPPQSTSEFEDSRYMLPLSVPRNELLPAFAPRHIYQSTGSDTPEGAELVSPDNAASGVSSYRPLQYEVRESTELRQLPDDFIDWSRHAEVPNHSLSARLRSTLNQVNPVWSSEPHKSTVDTVATPEKKKAATDRPVREAERSPVSPVFVHGEGLQRPVRLRHISSRSNNSLHQELHRRNADESQAPATSGTESPSKDRGTGVLGTLTQRFRARQASDASRDGYIDSSEDEESYH